MGNKLQKRGCIHNRKKMLIKRKKRRGGGGGCKIKKKWRRGKKNTELGNGITPSSVFANTVRVFQALKQIGPSVQTLCKKYVNYNFN